MILWVAVAVACSAAAAVVFSYFFARSTLHVVRQPRQVDPETSLPLETIALDGEAGKLRGWFISHSAGERRPTILLTHGWGRNAAQMLPFAEFLFGRGYNLCLFDVRGHGNSDSDTDGLVSMSRFARDIVTMARYCAARADVDGQHLGHLGHSMGAASSFHAAKSCGLFRCLIASSGFADLRDLVKWVLKAHHLPAFPFQPLILRFWRHTLRAAITTVNPIDVLPHLVLPVLVAHGEGDPVVPADQFDKLLAHARNGNVEGLRLPGRRHADLHSDPEYVRTVQDFFARYL